MAEEQTEIEQTAVTPEVSVSPEVLEMRKRQASSDRSLNDLLKEIGAKNPDEAKGLLAELKKAKETPAPKEPVTNDEFPDPAKFSKEGFNGPELDVAAYNRACHDHTVKAAREEARRQASGEFEKRDAVSEDAAVQETLAELPDHLKGDPEYVERLIRNEARQITGGKPATRSEIKAAVERVSKFVTGATKAALTGRDKRAAAELAKEAPQIPAGGKPPTEPVTEKIPDFGSMTEEQKMAYYRSKMAPV
ncbi:MAG: hypothetical protein IMZ57_04060 [Acidobacteria bacterium]|nr:hypothetical protein [Acidobacteriota bacterium]